MSFGETVSPVAAIQAILHDYPFSASILRELLQNSDDAGATKQIFLLDKDNPALVAYNDSEFLEPDWQAIQSIHQSSKKADTSKIGKYGVGFRACYHITDQPQILSGSFFAVLDPVNSKGMKIEHDNFKTTEYRKHFDFFLNVFEPNSFPGTAIRLPLRSSRSDLSQRIVHIAELQRMITDYISEELNVSLLFLDKLKTIEIWETGNGMRTRLAMWTKCGASSSRHDSSLQLITYDSVLSDGDTEYSWRIVQTKSPENEAITRLSQVAGSDSVNYIVQRHKLRPDVRIAYPLTSRGQMSGRLFTFLPLPSKTGFPVHVHALFALTSSRQSLRNPNETGIVQGSDNDVLIKWNQLLFNHYIPQGWSYLLKTLAEDASCDDILGVWPPRCSSITSGDGVYWQDILSNTFKVVVGSELKVWPKLSAQGTTTYIDLKSSLIVAQGQVDANVLTVFAELGLTLVQLSQSLLDCVDDSMTKLSPSVAHGKLQGTLDRFGQLSTDQRALVCKYLLSDNDISNIFGLPVIPVLNGSLIALVVRHTSLQRFVALTKDEARVFRASAYDAIPLDQLSPEMARLIQEQAITRANVDLLGPHYVIECISNGCHVLSDEWLIEFWGWLSEWHLKTDLFNLLKETSALQLIPTTKGPQPISFPIFNAAHGTDNDQLFEKLGLAFVTPALPASVIHLLLNHNILKNSNDLDHLLTAINLDSVASLTDNEAQSILRLATLYYGSISTENLEKLRKLPVFPLLVPTSAPISPLDSNSSVSWRSIHGINVKGISPIKLIPFAGDTHFLSGPSIEYSSCSLLRQMNISVLNEDDILLHALNHFTSQPKPLQAALVSYIRNNQYRLPIVTQTLRRTAFLRATDGSVQSPENVIDPNSPLASLFAQCCKDSRVPVNEDVLDQQLLGDLRTLDLTKTKLDAYLAQERISYISSNYSTPEATAIARSLLILMNEPCFSCFGLTIDPNICWLPTASGLTASKKCINSGRRDTDLFDQVLVTLDGSISISPSFKALLDWDKPLPLEVLTEQLRQTLDSPVSEVQNQKICSIVRELAGRQLRDVDIQDIQTTISGRPWVPTKSGRLAQPCRAVFVNVDIATGFHEVAFSKTEKGIYQFLCRIGCLEKPTAAAIIEELKELQEQSKSGETVVQRVILLLDMLPDSMTEAELPSVLVPDESGCLVPLSARICYYNGLGRERSEADDRGTPVAHHLVTEGLAEKLRMNRLGLEVEDDIDLGGKPITIIRNTLDQYDPKQFFTEFIANASDAKAKRFGLLIDDHEGPTGKLFSQGMNVFQNASLVVYNDSVFTQDDFKGIRETGIGGKRGKPDVIGYFGLGALSMFHFTELAMIVSGSHVLFLNPAKQSLAYRGRNSVLLSLQRVKRLYPDHLEPLNGLFGFDLNSTGPYQGTIFRLPLRNPSHLTNDSVSLRSWSVAETENMLLKQFDNLAYKSLLFTGLSHIDLLARRGSQSETLRSIGVARVPDGQPKEAPFKSEIATFKAMDVQMKWLILSQSVQIPEEFEKLLEKRYNKRHIPPIQVAAAIDGAQEFGAERNLFCSLPLPAATSLPVHISAPFILEQERRNIRLDSMGTSESGFNRWLLSSEIPRLYLYLLEILLETQGTNTAWWPPTRLGRNNGDSMTSQVIVDAFWTPEIFRASSRRIFASRKKPSARLAPKDAVAFVRKQNFFDTISRILDASNVMDVVELPSELWEDVNYAGLRIVDSSFVKTILEDSQVCQQLSRTDKYMSLLFLCSDNISLHNLALLPLEDESFATILLQHDSDTLYYVLEQAPGVSYPPFRKNRLIRRDFQSFLLMNGQVAWQCLLKDYNVSLLSEEGIVELINDRIKPADEFVGDQDHQVWVDAFWSAQLKLPQAVSSFPLVSTQNPLHYISLQKVDDPSVIVLEEPPKQRSHFSVLQSLGLVVVVRQALPSTLRDVLPTKRTGVYATFLDFVKKNPETLRTLRQLQTDEQQVLGSWIRAHFSHTLEDFADIACQLPVWPVHQAATRLAALNDDGVAILPPSIPMHFLQPFTDHFLVNWDDCMKSAMKEPCIAQHILELLHVSADSLLPEPAAYKEFVRHFMTYDRINDQRLLLPNGDFVLQRASDLYEHNEPFIATFKADSPFLLSQDFQDLAQDLERYGLKRHHRLDLSLFIECAKVFHSEEDSDDKQARANVLYQSFNSLQLSSLDSQRCSELDLLKFIPRVDSQRPGYDNINTIDYIAGLPQGLLAPSQITIPDFEAICWSRKGQTNPPPNATLCGTYQTLGKPDGADVLEHLAVLVSVAQEHGRRRGLLSDLRDTYKWLNDHANDIASIISQKKAEILFLNVDDPESDDWTWHSASNLVIDLQDIYDMHNVKGFLRNYNELLKSAGVRKVKKRTAEVIPNTDNILHHMRNRFNDMRQSGFGTDVVFKAQDSQCQILPAHKSWLVACNNHFRTTFITSGMKESRTLESDESIRVEHSSMCVKEVTDWFYVGKLSDFLINNSNNEEETKRRLELGLDMLSLADEWEVTDLHEQLQVFIINDQDFLNPYWVRRIQQHAEATAATRLLEYCQRYEEENRSIIDDCTHGEPEDDSEPREETAITQRNEEKSRSIIDDYIHQDPEDDSEPAEETVKEIATTHSFGHCQNEVHLEDTDTQPIVNNSAVKSRENVIAKQGLTPNEHPQTLKLRSAIRSATHRPSDQQIVTDLRTHLPAFMVDDSCLLNPHWVEQIRRHVEDTMGLLLFFFFMYLQTLLLPLRG